MHRVKGIDFLHVIGYAVACLSSHARVQEFLSGKLKVCKVLGGVSSIIQVVHLHISMETYRTCDFPRGWGSGPQPLFGSAHAFSLKHSSHTYVFFTLCSTTLHGYIKSAHDQSHDIWRLELGKVKNTSFLVKRKILFLRTI